jgi:ribosomal protein L39E
VRVAVGNKGARNLHRRAWRRQDHERGHPTIAW